MMYGTTYIVRPGMAPFRIAPTLYFAPPGSIQLLVGPTSSFSGMQMKVRCSVWATQGCQKKLVRPGKQGDVRQMTHRTHWKEGVMLF
jgi:hypothetical protein